MICPGCGGEHAALTGDAGIEHIPHLGASGIAWMQHAGIDTIGQLSAMGAVTAYLQVEALGVNPGINMLYALQAAIDGTHWLEVKRQHGGELIKSLSLIKDRSAKESLAEENLAKESLAREQVSV